MGWIAEVGPPKLHNTQTINQGPNRKIVVCSINKYLPCFSQQISQVLLLFLKVIF